MISSFRENTEEKDLTALVTTIEKEVRLIKNELYPSLIILREKESGMCAYPIPFHLKEINPIEGVSGVGKLSYRWNLTDGNSTSKCENYTLLFFL